MEKDTDFYTLKGYQLNENIIITYSMEDYLEMICRHIKENDYVRISELAQMLHVKPSSASKMVNNLKMTGLVDYEKYGYIKPTEKGLEYGNYLLYRHETLNEFLCLVNNTDDETELVEKIEHYLDKRTVFNIYKLTNQLKK
jgi:Mn-dependent DtxR family transcriptional regulator